MRIAILSREGATWYLSRMDLYFVSLVAGGSGLGLMALGGLSRGGGHSGHGPATHGGHSAHAGHVGTAGHAHGAHGGGHAAHHGHAGQPAREGGSGSGWIQSLLSPRVLFAVMVGFGAGGILATPLGEPWRAGAAILAAVGFETLLVGPLWRLLFRFESNPAVTLESSIEDDARAVTGFDADGCGLVALEVDGQIVQLLATLTLDERERGVRVRQGDVVRVDAVDAARNRCTVRSLGH